MRTTFLRTTARAIAIAVVIVGGRAGTAQQGQGPAAPPRNASPANMPLTTLHDMFVRFPLPPGQDAYARIDGKHIHQYVVEQANISRRYRDAGHSKFWGRIIGTTADAEDVEWMIAKFKSAGPNPTPPASDMSAFFRFLPGIDTGEYHHYFHTDLETPQTVPWTGCRASRRCAQARLSRRSCS